MDKTKAMSVRLPADQAVALEKVAEIAVEAHAV
jgi:hypothetical protein